jgi:hypothetical protein
MGRILGYVDVTASGSMTVPGFAAPSGGTVVPFARAMGNSPPAASTAYAMIPEVTISGTTLSWTYPAAVTAAPATITYGVY